MRKLIVNADDFGLTCGINKGIVQGFRLGIITSATAMVNMPSWHHAVGLAEKVPGLGIGLHFNLTIGRPVTPPVSVPTLVNGEGNFSGGLERLRSASPLDVARELYNQYDRMVRAGIRPTHIDSHQDVHALTNILPIILDFAADHSLPLRLVPGAEAGFNKVGAATTGDLIDKFLDKGANRPNFERLLRGTRADIVEFRCHPGLVDAELENLSPYTWQRERELAIVCAYSKENFPQSYGFELIPFSALGTLA